ncbi:ATP-NAD kinase [Calocera cornea HHB12733]|uniref:ATP-NAD kinase n=1 Tax=Calocera cornea HHB12733 TaxID=1353952 RepID=A0A165F4P2_9BASI|nr:ATP-NAD kinase [Calocera cornea HHB12733]
MTSASEPPQPARRGSRPSSLLLHTTPVLDGPVEVTTSPEPGNATPTILPPASSALHPGGGTPGTARSVQFSTPAAAAAASPLRQGHSASPTSTATATGPSPILTGRMAAHAHGHAPHQQHQQHPQHLLPRPHLGPAHAHPTPVPPSPCFVHSLLDKGVSLAEWLRENSAPPSGAVTPLTPPPGSGYQSAPNLPQLAQMGMGKDGLPHLPLPPHANGAGSGLLSVAGMNRAMIREASQEAEDALSGSAAETEEDDEDEDEHMESLTKQLADTAVGVREMSKQLGRVRVRSNIQNVLIVTKARDNNLVKLTRQLALYLMLKRRENSRGLTVYVDSQLRNSRRFDAAGIERDHPELFAPVQRRRSSSATSLVSLSDGSASARSATTASGTERRRDRDEGQLRYWTSEMCTRSPHLFDFVITLGGDGTVLFTSWLFQRIVPPVLPFALGSLGFLTNFDFAEHEQVMDNVVDSGIRVNLRMRFTCTVYRSVHREAGEEGFAGPQRAMKRGSTGEIIMKYTEAEAWQALEAGFSGTHLQGGLGKDREITCLSTKPVETFEILNDLVVDRGPSPYMSMLELFADEHHLTTVQADGLVIATPTGSTAYSLSAGGSLVHPEIPALLISPICPHTLSFRPMLLPDSMELRICVPYNSRSTAWASFDGRGRVELKQGDHIKITASRFPFPTVCADKQSTDWFHAISRTLKWNERERQKSFVVVEEAADTRSGKRSGPAKENGETAKLPIPVVSQPPRTASVREEEEDDDDGVFDIDDSSGDKAPPVPSSSSASSPKTPAEPSVESDPEGISSLAFTDVNLPDSYQHSKSGISTPGRYAGPGGPANHPPRSVLLQQRVHGGPMSRAVAAGRERDATRDAANSSIPSTTPLDNLRTPRPEDRTLITAGGGAAAGPAPSPPPASRKRGTGAREASVGRRAFAVYGHDESDSGTSGSED